MYGSIVDAERVVDEVVVGCEGEDAFVIHCHGNPLLAEQLVKLLQAHGAVLTEPERFAWAGCLPRSKNTIEAEARLAMQKSATLAGVRLLQAQIDGGLTRWAQQIPDESPDAVKRQCADILERSRIAKRIIEGARIVIAGPPNSGKSTLLNCLAAQEQVIVSDTAGTTRDWVSVTCQLGPVRAEFIDTAGLDDTLAGADAVEENAQQITRTLLAACDLVLYVQDATTAPDHPLPVIGNCPAPVIGVLNKCDLPEPHTAGPKSVCISAQTNTGIDTLIQAVLSALGTVGLNLAEPTAFTARHITLLSEFIESDRPHTGLFSQRLLSENLHIR